MSSSPERKPTELQQRDVERARRANDRLRRLIPARENGNGLFLTRGIAALDDREKAEVLRGVRDYDTFTTDNDPWGEHDFGSFKTKAGTHVFWKIDNYHGEDGYNLVCTIMLAEEY